MSRVTPLYKNIQLSSEILRSEVKQRELSHTQRTMGPPALIPDPEGSRLVCWNGEFTKYREVNMFVIDTIQARLEELETFKLMMESRTMLKVFSKGMVELRPSTISPCLRLIVPKATRSYKDYTKTRTFVEILRPYNAFAHSVWLQTDYQQLQSSRILRCLEDDILSINPDHKKVFKQLSRSDKISVLLGFPEQRIKRAIGLFPCPFGKSKKLIVLKNQKMKPIRLFSNTTHCE